MALPLWNLPPNIKKILAGEDNIHDFDDNGGRVPTYCWDSVSSNLWRNLNTLTDKKSTMKNDFTDWLHKQSGNTISASKVEEQTIIYLEKQYPLELRTNTHKVLTYRDIIGKDISEFASVDILELDIGDIEDWDRDYTEAEKKQIGLFILNYFFPPPSGDLVQNSREKTYISFDAGSNMPDNIFGKMDQVMNLVSPLNIADSALTEKHLNGKNYYKFVPTTGDGKYLYSSNMYTSDIIQLALSVNGDYQRDSRYDFSIDILANATYGGAGKGKGKKPPAKGNPVKTMSKGKPKPITVGSKTITPVLKTKTSVSVPNSLSRLTFNSTNKSGPSVSYLSESIENTEKGKPIPISDGTMVNIDNLNDLLGSFIKSQIIQLLFDLKRSGDWEQANATNIIDKFDDPTNPCHYRSIFATIDRLCSLYSRCISQNTIYHYSTKVILYRFPTGILTEEQKANNKLMFIKEKKAAIDSINDKIAKFKDHITPFLDTDLTGKVFKYKYNADIQVLLTILSKELLLSSNKKLKALISQPHSISIPADINTKLVELLKPNAKDSPTFIDNVNTVFDGISSLSSSFFDKLSDIYGSGITVENILSVLGSIKLPIHSGVFTDGKYFLYDSKLLNELKDLLSAISTFNVGRNTLLKQKQNEYCRFDKSGYLSDIERIIHKLSDKSFEFYEGVKDGTTDISSLSEIETICYHLYRIYTQRPSDDSCTGNNYTDINNQYVPSLKVYLDAEIAFIKTIPALAGGSVSGGSGLYSAPLTSEQHINIENGIQERLFNYFNKLSSTLSNIITDILDEYDYGEKQFPLVEYLALLFSVELTQDDKNQILLAMVEYITNVSSYLTELFSSIDELNIDKESVEYTSDKYSYIHGLFSNAGLTNIFNNIYSHIELCFLFGVILKKSGNYNLETSDVNYESADIKEQLKDLSSTDGKINFMTTFIPNIFSIFFHYFAESTAISEFKDIIEMFATGYYKDDTRYTNLKMILHDIILSENDPYNLLLMFFSVTNRLFIDNIAYSISSETPKDYGYYESILNLDESLPRLKSGVITPREITLLIIRGEGKYIRSKQRLVGDYEKLKYVFSNNLIVYNNFITIAQGLLIILKQNLPSHRGGIGNNHYLINNIFMDESSKFRSRKNRRFRKRTTQRGRRRKTIRKTKKY